MGGATSSTSKVVIVGPSSREDCDVDYRFGQVAIDKPVIDWSGNCGNLTAAVGPFAIAQGLVDAPRDGTAIDRDSARAIPLAPNPKPILNSVAFLTSYARCSSHRVRATLDARIALATPHSMLTPGAYISLQSEARTKGATAWTTHSTTNKAHSVS
jgi:hypothetical protein